MTTEPATASFDNLQITADGIDCPIAPGQIATFDAQVSSNVPGANADLTFTGTWSANSEGATGVITKIPQGFEIADGNTIADGEATTIGTLVHDWLCTGVSVNIPIPPLQKRPPFGSERMRSRALVDSAAADHIVEADPATGGYTARVYVSVDGVDAPRVSLPTCPPSLGTQTLLGMTAGGLPLVTNPSTPGLYPILRISRGAVSGTLFTQTSCIAIGGTIGLEFVDADGDCLLDSEPMIVAPTAGGGRLASPAFSVLDPNPAIADIDGDGLPDGVEVTLVGSNPALADTDGDTSGDRNEALLGSNPNVTNSDAD
jgi:hypothetical protein